jgi:hypothetical protein
MKNQKGLTLISVIIYVLTMIIVISIVANITRYFYSNVSTITDGVDNSYIFTAFNSYFSEEINIYQNTVVSCDGASIEFSHDNNKFTFKNDAIYFNNAKICDDVKDCSFEYDTQTKIITVILKSAKKTYTNTYTISTVKY